MRCCKLTSRTFFSRVELLNMYKEIEKITKRAIDDLLRGDVSGEVSVSKNSEHGDYSSSAPLKIAKLNGTNPIDEARVIAEKIRGYNVFGIERVEAVAPGFVNFFLSKDYLKSELFSIIKKGDDYGSSCDGEGKVMVIDYSSPNIAKSFGVGHLRSTIIGQAIYNIYRFLGWRCIGDNHLGDWGTQFGKLISQIKRNGLSNKVESLTIGELEELYIAFHREAERNPDLIDEGRLYFKKLESGDEEAMKIWKSCVETSMREFNRIYEMLGVKIDMTLGESFYTNIIGKVVNELKEKGLAKESRGALIVEFPEDRLPPLILVKSDGTSTYFARDLAVINYRIGEWNPSLIIYEVGMDQSLYFKQLFETANMLGWGSKVNFIHIAHGLVRWKHGKFSTRKGETIHLESILIEAVKRAKEIIDSSGTSSGLSEDEELEVARMVGIGAIKYNDLSQHYSRDILFDWDKILNMKGNSGPYIQYTFARTEGVLQKSGGKVKADLELGNFNTEELAVVRMVRHFPQMVEEAGRAFSPNIICNFLFDLAQNYNTMYSKHRIIGEDARVAITAAVNQVLKNGLMLLSIEAPKRM